MMEMKKKMQVKEGQERNRDREDVKKEDRDGWDKKVGRRQG